MMNQTGMIIFEVLEQLALIGLYLGAVVLSCLIFRTEKMRNQLDNWSIIIKLILFILFTHTLYSAVMFFVSGLISVIRNLIYGNSLMGILDFFARFIALVGLVVGIFLSVIKPKKVSVD